MTSAAHHLLSEDRPDFERALDTALRSSAYRDGDSGASDTLNSEQLRTMALSAVAAIAACAAEEYAHYVHLRGELRRPAAESGADDAEERPMGLADALGAVSAGADSAASAGLAAVMAVLAPVLAGAAAVIFLLVGYALHMLSPEPSVAEPLRTAGWVFATLTAATILIAMGGLVLTALRNGSTSIRAAGRSELVKQVEDARADWQHALLERGIVPFLREAVVQSAARTGGTGSYSLTPRGDSAAGRTPRLGYTRPGFSSPDDGSSPAKDGPRYSSPDFTSPDYGGPEHAAE